MLQTGRMNGRSPHTLAIPLVLPVSPSQQSQEIGGPKLTCGGTAETQATSAMIPWPLAGSGVVITSCGAVVSSTLPKLNMAVPEPKLLPPFKRHHPLPAVSFAQLLSLRRCLPPSFLFLPSCHQNPSHPLVQCGDLPRWIGLGSWQMARKGRPLPCGQMQNFSGLNKYDDRHAVYWVCLTLNGAGVQKCGAGPIFVRPH